MFQSVHTHSCSANHARVHGIVRASLLHPRPARPSPYEPWPRPKLCAPALNLTQFQPLPHTIELCVCTTVLTPRCRIRAPPCLPNLVGACARNTDPMMQYKDPCQAQCPRLDAIRTPLASPHLSQHNVTSPTLPCLLLSEIIAAGVRGEG
jgi:hypothetical protein